MAGMIMVDPNAARPANPLVDVNGPIDGNAFAVIGAVSKALKRGGFTNEAKEYTEAAFQADSYNALLRLSMVYANINL